jgi:hypothetical protein
MLMTVRNSASLVMLFGASSCTFTCTSAFYMHRSSKLAFSTAPSVYDNVPVVVEEALTPKEIEHWLSRILSQCKNAPILAQFEKDQSKTPMPLKEATKLVIEKSTHEDPIYLSSVRDTASHVFTEGIPLKAFKDTLFAQEHTTDEDTFDWFNCFAQYAKVHDTLVVAGEGSTSPCLQCHPYQKLILGLDGSQLIRILPPLMQQPNDEIRAWASPSYMESAFGFPVSNGYRANPKHDLFCYRHRDVTWELEQMTKEDAAKDKDAIPENKYCNRYDNHFQHWAEDPKVFQPSFEVRGSDTDQAHHDLWHSTVILPGDMVVIPPGWWYQTYNVEPSVSLLSQRCGGSAMASAFIHHALETSGVDRMLRIEEDDTHTEEEAMTIVSGLFEVLDEYYSSVKNTF